ncbi:uncharacterized protein LOC134520286, partial [Chroicocephalus ridibundus]|uniref:uncharacterized protein LOC134520286 n=1 Tax=Chroicocephalus ridibundus TaxID=1192867 RepID=UPI002FDE50AF
MASTGGHGTHGARATSRQCRVGAVLSRCCPSGWTPAATRAHPQGRSGGSCAMAARPHGAGALPHPCWGWGRLRSAVSLQGPPLWSCQPVPTGTALAAATPTPLGAAPRLPCSWALWPLAAGAEPRLLAAVSVQNLHLCEGYVGPDGRYHPGFYCPRLTDPAGHRYCCQASPLALKSCCSQLALEAITGVNLSSLAPPGLLRNPLALPFVGLYGLLILLLMAVDLFHFYRTRRCRLGRLLPRAR